MRIFRLMVFCLVGIVMAAPSPNLPPAAKPTHLMLTPSPDVNQPNALVIGLREISYSLPHNLQVQASLLDHIGRVKLGLKYQMGSNLSVGGGFGGHGHTFFEPEWNTDRLGLFLVYGLQKSAASQTAVTVHARAGNDFILGADIGHFKQVHEVWGVMGEVLSDIGVTYEFFSINLLGGIRITPPPLPILYFDLGIAIQVLETRGRVFNDIDPVIDLGVGFML